MFLRWAICPRPSSSQCPLGSPTVAPAPGAGNLETISSVDIYAFTKPAGALQGDFASSSSSLGYSIEGTLHDTTTGATVTTGHCTGKLVPSVPAGEYRIVVTKNGRSGTSQLDLDTA